MQEEIWKPAVGYENFYQVSNKGKIRSLDRSSPTKRGIIKNTKGKVLNLTLKNNGYLSVMLSISGKSKRHYVHRLVAETFILNPENKKEVNHINGSKTDNSVINLEWNTRTENIKHALTTNLTPKGEVSSSAKLTEKHVLIIRRLHRINPNFNKLQVAKKLGVQDATIHKIIKRQRWKHI